MSGNEQRELFFSLGKDMQRKLMTFLALSFALRLGLYYHFWDFENVMRIRNVVFLAWHVVVILILVHSVSPSSAGGWFFTWITGSFWLLIAEVFTFLPALREMSLSIESVCRVLLIIVLISFSGPVLSWRKLITKQRAAT